MQKVHSDLTCPICSNDSEKMFFTVCGHRFCEACRLRFFKSGADSISCSFCNAVLRKKDLMEKSKQEVAFENEMRIRNMLSITSA